MRAGESGLSLIEILVVALILCVTACLGLVVSMDSYRSYSYASEKNLLISLLQTARGQAINNIDELPHGVYISQHPLEYILFEGNSFTTRNAAHDKIFSANGNFQQSGLNEVVFSQLAGNPKTIGSIFLEDHVHPKITVSLNNGGQINAH